MDVTKSSPKQNSVLFWTTLIFLSASLLTFFLGYLCTSPREHFIVLFFFLPAVSFVCLLFLGKEQKILLCSVIMLCHVLITWAISHMLWPYSVNAAFVIVLIVGFAGMAVGLALKKHAVSQKEEQ